MAARSGNRFGWWLALLTAAGAAWRLGYLFAVKFRAPLLPNDSLYYSLQAARNAEGDWFRMVLTDRPGAAHGPLTLLYLTPWSLGAGDAVPWQRLATTLLGIATVALVGLLGRRLGGSRVGLIAAALAAAYPNLWINDSLVMSETLAALLVTGALLAALALDRRPGVGRAALVGVMVGLGTLTRSEIALCAVGFAVLAWWRGAGTPHRRWLPVAILGAAAATVAPWTIYNLGRFEHPVLLTTNDGATLLGANCDATYEDDLGSWDVHCLTETALANPGADESELSAVQRDEALAYVGDHLDRLPVVVTARVGRTLDLYGLDALVSLDVGEEKAEWAVRAGIACWWGLAALALVGWRALGRTAARPWLVVPLLAVAATTVLFYGAHRIRAPAEPVVVVLAAAGVAHLAGRQRAGAAPRASRSTARRSGTAR